MATNSCHENDKRCSCRLPACTIWCSAALLLGSCTVVPEPINQQERWQRMVQDRQAVFKNVQPITRALTLSDAMARAILYNLDHKLKRMEETLASGQSDMAEMELLPRLTVQAGYSSRNNPAGASSRSLFTGVQSLEASTSAEREMIESNLTVAWNVLDFGLNYLRAQQQADRYLITQERRRKVIHDILQEVRQSFWRALAAQRLLPEIRSFLNEARQALVDSQQAERQLLQPPSQALEYQIGLLETIYQITSLQRDLSVAQTQLSALINHDLNVALTLQEPDSGSATLPRLPEELRQLEEMALLLRPELREEDYLTRMDQAEARSSLLQLFPALNVEGGYHLSSNAFLYHQNWLQGSLQVAWNLLNLFKAPTVMAIAEAKAEIAKARRLSMGMAILTQLHVAKIRYDQTGEEYRIIEQMSQAAERLHQQVAHGAKAPAALQTRNDLERMQSKARSIYRRLQKELAYAELHNAAGRLSLSVGVDPLPDIVETNDPDVLSRAIQESMQRWPDGLQRASEQLAAISKPLSLVAPRSGFEQPLRINKISWNRLSDDSPLWYYLLPGDEASGLP
ncbi:TolC family protein [Candidatus Magnetaquicoccus inordinatus]|uniref:TolC family protein n=1 Tax=Candidatus Magnetaquicoccus inordinatus TaxID=2496818 RepID=UPI00102C1067|nr:TolC family protein [Candidatus Magnetaquicoccus inordinatus]